MGSYYEALNEYSLKYKDGPFDEHGVRVGRFPDGTLFDSVHGDDILINVHDQRNRDARRPAETRAFSLLGCGLWCARTHTRASLLSLSLELCESCKRIRRVPCLCPRLEARRVARELAGFQGKVVRERSSPGSETSSPARPITLGSSCVTVLK